jgi:hypothetical protein
VLIIATSMRVSSISTSSMLLAAAILFSLATVRDSDQRLKEKGHASLLVGWIVVAQNSSYKLGN